MVETNLITCRNCGGESPQDARFCIECGETLASATGPTTKLATPTCASCGSENLPDARFCGMCGRAMPGTSTLPQAWPQAVGPVASQRLPAPQVASRRAVPHATLPPVVLNMPAAEPLVPASPVQHHRRHSGPPPVMIVAILGFVALFILKAFSLPAILLILAAAFLIHQAERGRAEKAIRTIAIMGAGVLVLTNPRFWPILLIGLMISKMLGGRKVW